MSESETTPDRIEKKIVLRASQSRVWKAVSDSQQFGIWFGVAFAGPFVAGEAIRGTIQPTKVDDDVAKQQEPHRGHPFDWTVEKLEPERLISFRWHPFAIDKNQDYSSEPTTLVVFELSTVENGTLLTITESGFSKIPLARRAQAFTANEGGWEHQTKLLQKYLEVYAA
jgi:uncharacterized protein YndB with AHSA1/START domain